MRRWLSGWLGIVLGSAVCASQAANPVTTQPATQPTDLAAFRREHPTQLLHRANVPEVFRDDTELKPPAGVREVSYLSDNLRLHAWLSELPTDKTLHPAVVLCHEGHWFSNDDWLIAGALVKRGFVVMMPRLRAENGNPGDFECFGGEVNDVIAAGRTLADMPGVDRKRLFVAGIGDGGTLAALAAECDSPFALAAAMDAQLQFNSPSDFGPHAKAIGGILNLKDKTELQQRSAIDFCDGLRIPLHLTYSSDVAPVSAMLFADKARHGRHSVTLTKLGGNPAVALTRVLPMWVDLFNGFQPGLCVKLEPSAGWVKVPRQLPNELAGQMPITGAMYLLMYRPKASLRADLTTADFGKTLRQGQADSTKGTDATVTDLSPRPIPNYPDAMSFDITRHRGSQLFHDRVYVFSTAHYFIHIAFVARSERFADVSKGFDAIVARANEEHD